LSSSADEQVKRRGAPGSRAAGGGVRPL